MDVSWQISLIGPLSDWISKAMAEKNFGEMGFFFSFPKRNPRSFIISRK